MFFFAIKQVAFHTLKMVFLLFSIMRRSTQSKHRHYKGKIMTEKTHLTIADAEHLGIYGKLTFAFMRDSSSSASLGRRLNVINLLSGLCDSENASVVDILDLPACDLVEKHFEHPKIQAFFLNAKGTPLRLPLTHAEKEMVIWAMSETTKHKDSLE